jgi:hypothetical protein
MSQVGNFIVVLFLLGPPSFAAVDSLVLLHGSARTWNNHHFGNLSILQSVVDNEE